MIRLEIIHLRASGEPIAYLADRIRRSLADSGEETSSLTLYRRHGLETDLAIHIRSDSTSGTTAHQTALQLASELRAYGLVEHTRWEELP